VEEETVLIRGETWKLDDIREEVAWCRNRAWEFATYSNAGEHSHCSICSWTLMPSPVSAKGQGYRSGPNTWLCQDCYAQFVATA